MRKLRFETTVPLHGLACSVEAVEIDCDDAGHILEERNHFAQNDRLSEVPVRERKLLTQSVARRRHDLFCFIIRIDLDFARKFEERFVV